MNTIYRFLFIVIIIALTYDLSFAQTDDSKSLVKQGVALNDAGKYTEAIEKYTEALKADPNNEEANYEMGFTLYSAGRGKEAIPYLENILKSNGSKYEADDLLGSIYDDANEPEKAIECYKNGIKENPDFEHLHFNLGVSYLRKNDYADAEACEIDAIKLDQHHASSQRIYALAEYDQGKRICALLAWCSFLMIEPNTQRSVDVFNDVRRVINYGFSRQESH